MIHARDASRRGDPHLRQHLGEDKLPEHQDFDELPPVLELRQPLLELLPAVANEWVREWSEAGATKRGRRDQHTRALAASTHTLGGIS